MKETDKVRFVFASEETALAEKLKLLLSLLLEVPGGWRTVGGVSEHFQSEDLFNPVLSGERLHGGGMLH